LFLTRSESGIESTTDSIVCTGTYLTYSLSLSLRERAIEREIIEGGKYLSLYAQRERERERERERGIERPLASD